MESEIIDSEIAVRLCISTLYLEIELAKKISLVVGSLLFGNCFTSFFVPVSVVNFLIRAAFSLFGTILSSPFIGGAIKAVQGFKT